jgi:hypothetical protein
MRVAQTSSDEDCGESAIIETFCRLQVKKEVPVEKIVEKEVVVKKEVAVPTPVSFIASQQTMSTAAMHPCWVT